MDIKLITKELKRAKFGGQIITNPALRRCYGVDSSCYEYVPALVVFASCVDDIVLLTKLATKHGFSVTYRANGTSLSGQAQTDSVLCFVKCFDSVQINGDIVRMGASALGGDINKLLAPLGYKLGPDPATINAASIGGIVANNSSGMCCGVAQNSYQCIKDIKVVLSSGYVLDTSDAASVSGLKSTHKNLLDELMDIRREILADDELKTLIKNKFKIKNTTGYSLNAFIDYDDPVQILKHIMVGSEGTLGCIIDVSMQAVKDYKLYASALLIYKDYRSACEVIMALSEHKDIILSAEFMDYPSTKSVFDLPGVSDEIKKIQPNNGLILLKTGADDKNTLEQNLALIKSKVGAPLRQCYSTDAREISSWWAARSGLLPIVAGKRAKGTAVITEDFCFKIEDLADGIVRLNEIIHKHGFEECGAIAGHALEGNLHFILTPDLSDENVVKRFYALLDECVQTIVGYAGSLKAEHGTGRIIAPFVIAEWGAKAYAIKRRVKNAFDKHNVFNKDVIISDDKLIHTKNIKQRAVIDGVWDRCIECGFCERGCPSAAAQSLSPRHRIVLAKLIASNGGGDVSRGICGSSAGGAGGSGAGAGGAGAVGAVGAGGAGNSDKSGAGGATSEISFDSGAKSQTSASNERLILREQSEQAKSVTKSLNGSLSREDSNAGALPSASKCAPLELLRQNSDEYKRAFLRYGIDDCATCHACARLCPVGLDVGQMIELISDRKSSKIASYILNHQQSLLGVARMGLNVASLAPVRWMVNLAHKTLHTPHLPKTSPSGSNHTATITPLSTLGAGGAGAGNSDKPSATSEISLDGALGAGAKPVQNTDKTVQNTAKTMHIIYLSTCLNKAFAPNKSMPYQEPIQRVVERLCDKAGINLIYPQGYSGLCCGKAYSRYSDLVRQNTARLKAALEPYISALDGDVRVLLDHGACSSFAKGCLDGWAVIDSLEFASIVLDRVDVVKKRGKYGAYTMCATKQRGLDTASVLGRLVDEVISYENIECCGFAGYKGFFNPRLNEGALGALGRFYAANDAVMGFGNSSTCEVGLSKATNMPWQSVLYILDECAVARKD